MSFYEDPLILLVVANLLDVVEDQKAQAAKRANEMSNYRRLSAASVYKYSRLLCLRTQRMTSKYRSLPIPTFPRSYSQLSPSVTSSFCGSLQGIYLLGINLHRMGHATGDTQP